MLVALFYIRIKALSPGCDIQGPDAVARGPSVNRNTHTGIAAHNISGRTPQPPAPAGQVEVPDDDA